MNKAANYKRISETNPGPGRVPVLADEEEQKSPPPDKEEINGRFLKTRTILLSGEVNKELAEKVIKQLLLMEAENDEPIRIFIDSPGGDVDAGFAIFDMIRFVKPEVYEVGMGLVASVAALILLAVPRDHRVGLPNSHYLIHQPWAGLLRGVATDIEIHAKEMEKCRSRINRIIAGETGIALDRIEKDTDRDYWLSAEESLEYGLISRIITRRDELC
ncbi:MAG: ATP-dependent Clp protease proteolytic subunit [Spirochaetales bacterium]|jgi:ATP-dependent Clp protease protease subunit|nr:ATP-dependent Clp protease proteolytic subunit [Spirochaetales bacterium]